MSNDNIILKYTEIARQEKELNRKEIDIDIDMDIEIDRSFTFGTEIESVTGEILHEKTIKQLMQICNYYEIDKYIKASKCKKQDIIDTIIYYENEKDNWEMVEQRKRLWFYLNSLQMDPKMRQYIIWF